MSEEVYLSVIIPAYNEEKRLPKTLREINQYLARQDYSYEIIVVSDGSKDRTVEVAQSMEGEIRGLRVLDRKENRGKGYTVKEGMLAARGKYRLFTDADNSTSIDQIEKIWPHFERGYEIVIGSRDIEGAKIAVPQTWWRRKLGDIFNILVQALAGLWGIWDTQCGFKGLTAEAAEKVFPKVRIERFAFDPEILIIAKRLGYRIKEIPVTWVNSPESKVKFAWMVQMLLDLLRIRWNMLRGKYNN